MAVNVMSLFRASKYQVAHRLARNSRDAVSSVTASYPIGIKKPENTSSSGGQPPNGSPDLNFRDPRTAHISKTNLEIIRGLFVYKLFAFKFLVQHNKEATFYGHFVGGEDQSSITPVIRRLRKYGVKSILDYSAEKDIGESEAVEKVKESLAKVVEEPVVRPAAATKKFQTSLRFADRSKEVVAARTYYYESEYQCDKNMETFLRCIDYVSSSTEKEGFAAIKVTALGRPQLLMQRLFNLLVGSTEPGVGGSRNQLLSLDMDNFRERLEWLGVKISYDDNMKWFTLLDVSGDGVVDLLDWSHLKAFEYDLAGIFTIKNRQTGNLEQLVPTLTPDGLEQMRNMLRRMDSIASHARSAGVRVMVDAEQNYFQPAIRRITVEMMRLFNRESAVIFNTYQCYLKDAREYLVQDLNHAASEDFYFGAKLVRGAYMEQERARAAALDYDDPICPSYEATSDMYQSCIVETLNAIKRRPIGRVSVMMATHNDDTIRYALRKMHEHNVTPDQRLICFGQLLGMCDQLSFTLGQSGYSVYKYVPYGPVDEVLPYLSRRALENGSLLSNTKVERQMMWDELKRRMLNGQFLYRP